MAEEDRGARNWSDRFLLFVVIGTYVLFGVGILSGILLLLWYEPWKLLQYIMVIIGYVGSLVCRVPQYC